MGDRKIQVGVVRVKDRPKRVYTLEEKLKEIARSEQQRQDEIVRVKEKKKKDKEKKDKN